MLLLRRTLPSGSSAGRPRADNAHKVVSSVAPCMSRTMRMRTRMTMRATAAAMPAGLLRGAAAMRGMREQEGGVAAVAQALAIMAAVAVLPFTALMVCAPSHAARARARAHTHTHTHTHELEKAWRNKCMLPCCLRRSGVCGSVLCCVRRHAADGRARPSQTPVSFARSP